MTSTGADNLTVNNNADFRAANYLIIGGTTKAATTSLYYYLGDHPQVCISSLKETRFFIDDNYPVSPLGARWLDGADRYGEFFLNSTEETTLRVEASPDYLYSASTPGRIKDTLPNAKLVFLLRNPISRLVSWYKYARQRADIDLEMSFDEYVTQQMQGNYFAQAREEKDNLAPGDKSTPREYFMCALEHGCYATYLQPYFSLLGAENIHIAFYEDLSTQPAKVVKEICDFAGLDSGFYDSYNFKIFNQSQNMRNPQLNSAYDAFRSYIRQYTHNLPIHVVLRKLRKLVDPLYYGLNARPQEKIAVSPEMKATLKDYYRQEIVALENLLGYPVPWEEFKKSF